MTYEMSFQKNTQTIAREDPLNELSTGWKIAAKSGKIYCRLDTVTDADLGAAVEAEMASGNPQPINYAGSYFAPIDRDGSVLVYAFTSEDDATNFLNYKPAAGFHPKGTNTYKPKTTWGGNKTSYGVKSNASISHTVTTFTDLEEVELTNKDRIRENERQGMRILPQSLVGNSTLSFNSDGKRVLLMGKIINVQPIQQ